jgi:hypothetical protein
MRKTVFGMTLLALAGCAEPSGPSRRIELNLYPRTLTLDGVGQSAQFLISPTALNGYPVSFKGAVWSSLDETVVSIHATADNLGKVTSRAVGVARIRVELMGVVDTATVTVRPGPGD